MFQKILSPYMQGILFSLFATPLLVAQATQVKIVGPGTDYTNHDIATIALDLGEMLKATPGRSGSTASATVLSGRSLIESYYHPEKRGTTRTVLDTKFDHVVIIPEVYFLHWIPEATFDGVLQMSRRALNAGSTPLLLMPRGDTYPIDTLGVNSYRIGNGSGIVTAPGGYAVNSVSGLSSPGTDALKLRQQAYLLAATLFSQITGLNAATATTYAPSAVGTATNRSNLAGKAASAVTTHASSVHYTTSRHLSGIASYRTITPPNNRFRYAFTGTSTENGISDKLDEIIQSSGHIAVPHIRPTSDGQKWTQTVFDRTKSTFDAAPNEYLLLYGRDTEISAQSLISYNQANLVPTFIDRHYDGVQSGDLSTRILLRDLHERTDNIFIYNYYQGWKGMFLHLGHARLNDVDPSIYYSGDGTHMTSSNYYMAAAMMFTSTLGKDPTAPVGLTAQQLKGLNVGKQMAKELAFLSETMAFTPESTISIVPPAPLEIARWETFSHTFTATGGTPPYTWSESSDSGLPAGLSLTPGGVLSGAVTSSPQTWNLVIKATDCAGAIHKVPFTLNVTAGVGSLAVTQTTSFTAVIPPGGPAPSAAATYTVQNPGLTSINWTASKTQPWITLNLASGTLAPGASVDVTVSMNSAVNSLAIGTHTDTISFTNTTSGFGNTGRNVSLRVSAPPTVNAGADLAVSFESLPWTPAVMNPVGWYDASDASTVMHTSGSVSEWKSKSGSSHMLQTVATKQPISGTKQINGLNAIAFDGTDDGLMSAANPFGSSIKDALFMAVTNVGSFGNSSMFSLSGSSADASKRWQSHAPYSDGTVYFDCGQSSGANRVQNASGWSANQNKLLGFYSSTTTNVQQIWQSGTLFKGDTTGHTVSTTAGMALGYAGDAEFDNCTMGEVVIVNGVVSNASRQLLEGYLAHKWGFAATLPSNHPCKTAPPGAGTLINLSNITSSDADNEPLTYAWTVVGAPAGAVLLDPDSLTPSVFFSAPGTYTLRLTVSDGYSQVTEEIVINVTPNVAPVANAGSNLAISLSAWTPDALNPLAWYDASDATTIVQSSGLVSEWRSKVGTSHMLQNTAGKYPATGTKQINGLNVIAFDGSNDALKTAANPFGTAIQNAMFMGVFNLGTFTDSTLFSLSGSSNSAQRFQSHSPYTGGTLYFDTGGSSGVNRLQASSGWSANQNKLLGFYGSVTDNVQQVWDSGTLKLGDATGHSVSTHSGIALGHDGSGSYDNCTMGEVLIINGVVTTENRQRLEGYLGHKWGMASTLPANHPYKVGVPLSASAMVSAASSDANNDALTHTWTVVSGPAGYMLQNADSLNARLVTNVPGTYTLCLTVSDGSLQASDEVTITVLPEGGVPQVNLTTTAVNGDITLNPAGGTYDVGTVVTVTAAPNTGYRFNSWSGAASGSATTTTIVMDANKSVTADFIRQFTLNASATNGTVTLNPPGGVYDEGTNVTVTAAPIDPATYRFSGWNGALSGTSTQGNVVMDGSKTIAAIFSQIQVASFNTVGTHNWTCPEGVTGITVECRGGGGAGGSAKSTGGTSQARAGGGAGGSYAKVANLVVIPGTTYKVVVGAGGVPVSSVASNNTALSVQTGGTSTFSSSDLATDYVKAMGGAGGRNSLKSSGGALNVNGGTASSIGNIGDEGAVFPGGSGGNAGSSSSGGTGAGGGGGGAGNAGPGGTPTFSLTGGAGGTSGGGSGGTGRGANGPIQSTAGTPGGGGGAVVADTNQQNFGGAGGRGDVVINYVPSIVPSPWLTADIGAVATSGSASYASPTWTIEGSGADIWSSSDEFRYVHQDSSGDCSIVARVADMTSPDPWAKSGVMIRESTAADSIHAMVSVTPGNGVSFQWRNTSGGACSNIKVTGQTAPKWLKLTRTGDAFAAFHSDDNVTWTQVGTTQTIGMTTGATLGMAVTSRLDGALCTSTVDSVTATP